MNEETKTRLDEIKKTPDWQKFGADFTWLIDFIEEQARQLDKERGLRFKAEHDAFVVQHDGGWLSHRCVERGCPMTPERWEQYGREQAKAKEIAPFVHKGGK